MALQKTDLELFPEEYLLEEDEMGESNAQFQLIRYLVAVLEWLFHIENWYIAGNLELYHHTVKNSQNKITPDISVFKGIIISPEARRTMSSWTVGPAEIPPVLFEISSASTWRSDIVGGEDNKPAIYGRLGVKEYFAYDPNEPAVWRATRGRRLLGWRYEKGNPVEILPDGSGRLWSNELNSWLVADGPMLQLYDRDNNLRLTEGETYKRRAAELEQQLRELKEGQG
jgi:Uma2 family endonuclease